MEIWLVPLNNTRILVPYRLLIGTRVGDLMIYATRFSTDGNQQRASAD